MGSSLRWLAVSSVSLALACSARGGGGGGIIGGDASGGSDVTSGIDGGVGDVTAPPVDDGLPPEDRGKTPPDVSAPDDIAQPDVVSPVDTGPPPMCGDGFCNGAETCTSCERDCGPCAATCGNGACNEGETCRTCPGDCGACPPMCGDATCNGTETCTSCPADCGACPARCGDATCNGTETCGSCPGDCGACPARCGDGSCNGAETCMTCPGDCGACSASCGDGVCNGTETCTNCPTDCGACAPRCGDGSCNGSESCSTCPGDCGTCAPSCGDGSCNGSESCSSCAVDCGTCPTNCASITSCAACLSDSRCGWCTFPGNCAAGDNSGPSNPSDCFPVFGTWVRTPSMCSSSPPDAGTVDTGVTSDPTRACAGTSGNDGLQTECGWRTSGSYTCTAGSSVTVGCTGSADAGACGARLGSCSGDPMIRVCPGSTPCIYSNRIPSNTGGSGTGYGEDDGCGLCPLVRVTCPSSGRITVLNRGYYQSQSATCSVSRL